MQSGAQAIPLIPTTEETNQEIARINNQYKKPDAPLAYINKLDKQKKWERLLQYAGKKLNVNQFHTSYERQLTSTLETSIKSYANVGLKSLGGTNYEIPDDQSYSKVKESKANAVSQLLDLFSSNSAKQIYDFIQSPHFQNLIHKKTVNFSINPSELRTACQEFCSQYQEFLNTDHDNLILEILLDKEFINTASVSNKDLSYLLWSYNVKLIADIIVNVYKKIDYKDDAHPEINYELLKKFLSGEKEAVNRINEYRKNNYATIFFPENSISPGKDPLLEESLSVEELFQYDDSTLAAIEEWLLITYSHLFVNNITGLPNKKELFEKSDYYFYLIPSAEYMLVSDYKTKKREKINRDLLYNIKQKDCDEFSPYEKFKKDLNELLQSGKKNKYSKPIIFTGIVNIDRSHYIPYFIFLDTTNKTHVISVDPSPVVYQDKNKDSKLISLKKMENIFKDLIPNCNYQDLKLNQMSRERDCGPCSATTIEIALKTTNTNEPFLLIMNNTLIAHVHSLTHFDPIGYNSYTGKVIYPNKLEEVSKENRKKWANRLQSVGKVRPFTMGNSEVKTILTEYSYDEQFVEDYNYLDLAHRQTKQDSKDINVSQVIADLRSSEEGPSIFNTLLTEYKETAILPDGNNISRFLKNKYTAAALSSLTSAHGSISELSKAVVALLLKNQIIPVILGSFTRYLKSLRAHPDLNASEVVDQYLTDHQHIYKKLNQNQQVEIRNILNNSAIEEVKNKLIQYYLAIVEDKLFSFKDCRVYLNKLNIEFDNSNQAENFIFKILSSNDRVEFFGNKYSDAISYLMFHDKDQLFSLVSKNLKNTFDKIYDATQDIFIKNLEKKLDNDITIAGLLDFYSDDGSFKLLDNEKLTFYLKDKNNISLVLAEMQTNFGKSILSQVAEKFKTIIDRVFQNKADSIIAAMLKNQDVKNWLTAKFPNPDLALDQKGCLLQSAQTGIDLEHLLQLVGANFSEVQHPAIAYYFNQKFNQGISKLLISQRNEQYKELSSLLLTDDSLKLMNAKTDILSDNDVLANNLYKAYKSTKEFKGAKYNEDYFSSPDFIHFDSWFKKNKLAPLSYNFQRILDVKEKMLNALSLLKQMKSEFDKSNYPDVSKAIDGYIEMLKSIVEISPSLQEGRFDHGGLDSINIGDDKFEQIYKGYLKFLYVDIILSLIDEFFSVFKYEKGDVKFGSLTSLARPFLYGLFGGVIKDEVLTTSRAHTADKNFINLVTKIKDLDFEYSSIDQASILPSINLSTFKNESQLPDTYDKPLTKEVLMACIAYWYSKKPDASSFTRLFTISIDTPLIQELIKIVNRMKNTNIDEIVSKNDVSHLRELIFDSINNNNTNDQFMKEIYASQDPLQKIKAALLKTNSFTNSQASSLNFTEISHLIKGKKLEKRMSQSEFNQKINAAFRDKQKEYAINVNQLRDPETNELKPGAKLPTMPNRNKIKDEMEKKLKSEGWVISVDDNPLLDFSDLPKSSDLQATGLWSLDFLGMTHLEKTLRRIEVKHGRADFILDVGDIEDLARCIKNRWNKLIAKVDREKVKHKYLKNPNRKDLVYIAMAKIISKYYLSIDELIYMQDLLFPGEFNAIKIKTYPDLIWNKLSQTLNNDGSIKTFLSDDENTVSSIKIDDLIITKSGYAFDVNWFFTFYEDGFNQKKGFFNFYTNEDFLENELKEIVQHHKARDLYDFFQSIYCTSLTQRCLDYLTEYLIDSTFLSGFTGYYSDNEKDKLGKAYLNLMEKVKKLPEKEQKYFLNERIPNSDQTIDLTLKASNEICVTIQNGLLARVLIAYGQFNKLYKADGSNKRDIDNLHTRATVVGGNLIQIASKKLNNTEVPPQLLPFVKEFMKDKTAELKSKVRP